MNSAAINKRRLESPTGFPASSCWHSNAAASVDVLRASFIPGINRSKKTQFFTTQITIQSRSTSQAPPSPQRPLQITRSESSFHQRITWPWLFSSSWSSSLHRPKHQHVEGLNADLLAVNLQLSLGDSSAVQASDSSVPWRA